MKLGKQRVHTMLYCHDDIPARPHKVYKVWSELQDGYRGPTGTLLNELADASFDGAACEIIYVRQCFNVAALNLLHECRAISSADHC